MAQPLLKLPNPKIGDGKVKLDIKVKGKKPNPFASGSLGGALVGAAGSVVGGLGKSLISGGLSSDVGEGVSNIGGQLGGAISTVNPLLGGIVSAGSGLIGGGINALFGMKTNEALLNRANSNINAMTNFTSDATTTDDLQGVQSVANVGQVYEGGVFSGGEAERKNKELQDRLDGAVLMANRNVLNNANNIESNQINDALANYSAFGGFLGDGTGMGAIDYDFMTDYLTQKKRENDMKSKMNGIVPIPAFMPNSYAIGGDLQTNGGDFSSGLAHINAGLSHELNPNEGVQMGVDNEGTPNLVEEGETVYNDYVFSTRIPIDDTTKELFHIGKKRKMTYADLSKKLEKEIAERPNDPISKAGFEKQMQMLEEQQERQKQEMEAERAKAAFEALSPEEQVAVMEGAAQQEAMAQQAAEIESQAINEGEFSNEALPVQQQMADGSGAALGQEPEMNCFGGKINRFDLGGRAYTKMLNSLDFHTQKEFDDWAKENNIDLSKVWDTDERTLSNDILSSLWKDENFKKALKVKNPALAHAFSEKGYDWGAYQPTGNNKATIQSISKGNWKTTDGKGWRGSDDLAFKQATEGLSDAEINALTTEQLAERMRKTAAYQNTNKWLQNSDNALQYLNTLLNDPDTPEVAREYARKFVKDGKWKDGFNYDYATVFGSNGKGVRETNPGTYWHTVLEANRGNQTGNFVINEDGTIEPILGDVPTDWTSAGNYTWADEGNDYTYNYYKRPVVATPTTQPTTENETSEGTKNKGIVPDLKKETSFGLFGPAVGLGLMGLGVGKPDTGSYDAAVSGAGDVTTARWKPLGNYLTYRPLDIWYAQNAMNAQSMATDRQLMNTSGGNRGTVMAGLLSNGYNSQLASGNLFRQAQEYNDNLRRQVADFNRGTDQFNSEQFGRTSQFNADAYNRARQADAQLRLQAASAKDDANRWWASNLYGNINGLFDNINQWEKWKRDHNTIANMYANGLAGVVSEDTPVARGYVKEREKSRGGKLKKRGLTI